MLVLDLGEFQQELARGSIAGVLRGSTIKSRSLEFHVLGVFAHVVDAKRTYEPERLLVDEALHVLAADEWQVIAELRPVEVEQHGAVAYLLVRHLVEHLGGGAILLAEALREAAIDAAVLLFVANGERQNFLRGEVGEALHVGLAFWERGNWRTSKL